MKSAMAQWASSPTLDFASQGWLAQSRPKFDPSVVSDEEMAWLLVDVMNSHLTGYERTVVFVELGCGESYLAIKRILTAVMLNRMPLPLATLSKVIDWLNGYAGSSEEPGLRMMVDVIRARLFEAV